MVEITRQLVSEAHTAFGAKLRRWSRDDIEGIEAALTAVAPLIEAQARGEMEDKSTDNYDRCLELGNENDRIRAELAQARDKLQHIADMGPMAVDDQRWRIARQALISEVKE